MNKTTVPPKRKASTGTMIFRMVTPGAGVKTSLRRGDSRHLHLQSFPHGEKLLMPRIPHLGYAHPYPLR
jgi:hypothetical protein